MRSILSACPHLQDFSDTSVDWSSGEPGEYGIYPTGCAQIDGTQTMDGSVQWQYSFSVRAYGWTVTDVQRMENNAFLEHFTMWLRGVRSIPMPDGLDFISLRGGNGMFIEYDAAGQIGTYDVQCNLIYEEEGQ